MCHSYHLALPKLKMLKGISDLLNTHHINTSSGFPFGPAFPGLPYIPYYMKL